jgi:hypothetical protein
VNLTAWYWESFKPWKKARKTPPSSPVQLSSAGHDDDDECWGSWTGSNISRQDSKKDWSNSTQDSNKGWWDHNWGWDQKHDWSQEKEAWGWDQKHDWHVRSQMEVASKELSARKRKAAAELINIDKAQRCWQVARDLMSWDELLLCSRDQKEKQASVGVRHVAPQQSFWLTHEPVPVQKSFYAST